MIIVLSIILAIVVLLLISAILHIQKLREQLIIIDKEQHTQNMDIINLLKYKVESTEILLQHVEVLQYLVDQDPRLTSKGIVYSNIIGEA